MSDYVVTHVRRNRDRDITALGNFEEEWLHEREDVIKNIRAGESYHVRWPARSVEIKVVHHHSQPGDYLRTEPDNPSLPDGLEQVPDWPLSCP